MFKATTGGKMLFLGPQVVALIIFKGLRHVVRIPLGTPVGGLNIVSQAVLMVDSL